MSGVKKVLLVNAANIQMSWKEWRQILFRRRKVRKFETETSAGFKVKSEKKEVDIKPAPPAEVPCGWRVTKQTESSRMMVRKKNRPKGERSWSVPSASLQKPEGPSVVAENDVVKPSNINILPDSQWAELFPPAATREGLPTLVFFTSSKFTMRTCTVLSKELRNTAIGEKRNQLISLANRLRDSKLEMLVIELCVEYHHLIEDMRFVEQIFSARLLVVLTSNLVMWVSFPAYLLVIKQMSAGAWLENSEKIRVFLVDIIAKYKVFVGKHRLAQVGWGLLTWAGVVVSLFTC